MAKRNNRRAIFIIDAKHRQPIDQRSRSLIGSSAHKLEKLADKYLAQAGFFVPEDEPTVEYRGEMFFNVLLPAEAIAAGRLKPTWHGRP
jgi:hypothetical protein